MTDTFTVSGSTRDPDAQSSTMSSDSDVRNLVPRKLVGWVETVVTGFRVTRSDVHSGGVTVEEDSRNSVSPSAAVSVGTGDVEEIGPASNFSSGDNGELDFVVVGSSDVGSSSAFSGIGPTSLDS